jgi:hypothetical protein
MIRSGKRGIKARSDLTNFRELLGEGTEKRGPEMSIYVRNRLK